ncbi:MAG TPA: hypothetical protein PLO16_05960 [Acidocella sp.]|nr:hypothetical protein [Acidocella sp.]
MAHGAKPAPSGNIPTSFSCLIRQGNRFLTGAMNRDKALNGNDSRRILPRFTPEAMAAIRSREAQTSVILPFEILGYLEKGP